MSKKTVSFDIWDTIIKRKCHPEEIKLKTAYYLLLKYNEIVKDEYKEIYKILLERDSIEEELCNESKEKGNDSECRIEEVFKRLTDKILNRKVKDISEELLNKEIEIEKEMAYINPDILEYFDKYKEEDIYCISDFYMSSNSLKEILDYLKLPVKIKKIYSSADYLLNKKSGRLYEKFHKEQKVDVKDHIHIGDNEFSDIEVAEKLGIETIKVEKEDHYFEPKRNRKVDFKLDSIKKSKSKYENRIFNSGVDLALLLYSFVYNINEHCIKNKTDKVYYQTREGETFIKVHDLFLKNNPFPTEVPKCSVMEVSRMSTFAASLNEFSTKELRRLWSQYQKQSVKVLFKTLNISVDNYMKYFEKYNVDIELKEDLYHSENFNKLCKDKDFCNSINKELKSKRDELFTFFKKNYDIVNDDKPLFIVDIGWRGTIQDNLAYIFDKKQVSGYYITLFDYYNTQPKNTDKHSLIDNTFIRDNYVVNMITLLEWIYNPGTGSVVEYKNGKSIRKIKDKETNVVKKYIKPLQEGMFEGIKLINEYLEIHTFEGEELKENVYELIKEIKTNPSKELIDAYYSMVFNDTFGAGNIVEKNNKLSFIEKLNVIKCRNILRKEDWKEAFMTYNNLKYMNIILNFKAGIRKFFGKK